jgi:trehalose-6-phosphate synthase
MIKVITCVYGVLFIIIAIEIKAKLMKLLIIATLMIFSSQSYAVEFYQCTDKKGRQHFTNLPASSLDSNCKQKTDRYTYLINQDYSNLENKLKNYSETLETDEQFDDALLSIDNFTDPIKNILDPDKALEQLLDNATNKDENMATEFFNARSKAIESILSEEKSSTQPD